ncbi:helix-turn-helix domain-containing protein [Paraburkholderia phymatum]|uniref:Helix-turn-helix domain-containing protein n=1 Tax=Paraburkholderia phymatum TaxID=148447 RepID=A0ACC6U695_9BURK
MADGFSLLSLGMLLEVFRLVQEMKEADTGERRMAGAIYTVQILSRDGGAVTGSAGARIWTCATDDHSDECGDTLLVAGPFEAPSVMGNEIPSSLGSAGNRTGTACPAVSGAAHIPSAARWSESYEIARDALAIVSRDFGETIACEIAERLLPGAAGRLLPAASGGDAVNRKVRCGAQWLIENCDRPITIEDAAQEVAMSRRNFLRRFRLEMGSTPSEYLLRARLEMASRLLAETELPVDRIARRCVMGNGDNLAKIFRKRLSISPTEYRAHYRRGRCMVVDMPARRSQREGSSLQAN